MIALLIALGMLNATPGAFALEAKHGKVTLESLDDYELCQAHDTSGDWCHDALKRWVKDHPADAFRAGKLTRHHMNGSAAMPFFAAAFDAGKGDCNDEDVKIASLHALDLAPDSSGPELAQAKKIALNTCFGQLKNAVNEAAQIGSNTFKNSCETLKAKGVIQGLKAKHCGAEK